MTAKAACQADGAWLATIPNQSVQGFINSLFDGDLGTTWVGLTDQAVEGSFVWDHGEAVSYTNWYPGEPNSFDGNNEDCVCLYNGNYGTWNDAPCFDSSNYACERLTDLDDGTQGNFNPTLAPSSDFQSPGHAQGTIQYCLPHS